ncbi:MAG: TIGR03435 family protein [Acidobacteriia bacterium]|nr:TIGR03435 family protein [Terriglobia bacterium]
MKRMLAAPGLLVLVAGAGFAQTPAAAPLSFEVATVKASAPTGNMIRVGVRSDAGRVEYNNMAFADLLRIAFKVKDYQIEGPDWLRSERFNIVAKLPDGANREQIPEMLQTLLTERFQVKFHRDKRDLPVYALVAGKNGPKLQKSDENDTSLPGGLLDGKLPPPPSGAAVGHAVSNVMVGSVAGGGRGGPKGVMMMDSSGRLAAKKASLTMLADMLTRMLDRPVVDETGIEGDYDFELEFSPEEAKNMRGYAAMAGAPGPGSHAASPADAAPEPGQSIFTSIQKVGLKLEPRKSPTEIIVIDRAEKLPTEN